MPVPGQQAQPRSIYDDIADQDVQNQNRQVAQAVATSVGNNPDAVGQAQQMGAQVGVGADVALEHMDDIKRSIAVQQVQERDLASWNPMLARQLSDPSFAAIAHDQIDNLQQTGTLFQRTKDALAHPLDQLHQEVDDLRGKFAEGQAQYERGMLGIKAKRGEATAEDWARINALTPTTPLNPQTVSGKVLGGVSSMAGSLLPMVPRSLAVGAGGAGVGAAVGSVAGGVGAVPGAVTGFKVGFESEFGAQNYELMAGNAYADMLERGVDESRAQWAAGTVGAVNTALQLGIMRVAGKPLAGVTSQLFNRALGDTVADAMTQPTTSAAMKAALLTWGKNTAVGTGEMGLQTIVDRVGQDYADKKGLAGTSSDLFSADFGKHLGQSLVDAALTMGTINATTGMMGFSANMDRVARAEQSAAFFEDLSKNATDSKVRDRNPDSYESFIANQAQGTGAENIYIDGKEMANLLNQSGLDPEKLEAQLPGLRQQVADAAAIGGDVTMPTEQYAARLAGTDLGKAMQAHMRLDPDAMSATEALEFQQKQKEIFEQTRQEAEQQTAGNAEFAKSAKVVEGNIYDQLKATKTMPDDAARTNAQFVRDFVVTQAARQGMTPEAFFEKYKYTIQRAASGEGMLHQSVEAPMKPLHEMSPTELDAAEVEAKGRDKSDLKEMFGEEGAQQYANLKRASESMDFKRADAAQAEVEQMEEGLSPTQRDLLFGIGDERPQLDEIREYRNALGQVDGSSPDGLAESLRYAVAKVDDPGVDPAEMTPEQRMAYAQLRHGFEIASQQGWDAGEIIKRAITSSAQRFADPEDAMLMLEQVARSVSPGAEPAAKRLGDGMFHQSDIASTVGRDTTLLTSNGKMPAKYVLVEAADLIPSHDPSTFAKDARYPEGVQERAYDKSKEAQARVIDQAQNYEPAYTVNTNPDAVNGPPVITNDGTVLGGNSRTMSTIRLYRDGNGDVYRDALKRSASAFGISPEAVDGMKEPILVRRVETDGNQDSLRRLGTDLNRSMTGALGAAEKAVSAGKNIKPETLRSVSDMLQTGDYTLRELMAAEGPKLVQMMVSDGVISDRERPQYVDTATGGLNDVGKAFVEKALLGSVIDDPRLMEDAPKSVLNKIERSLGPITSFSSRADEWNILPAIRAAVGELGEIQRAGSSVELWTGQTSLFGDTARNPLVDAMIRALDGKPNALKDAFESYSKDADANLPGQSRMFGSADAFEAFNHAFGSTLTEQEYHDGLERAEGTERAAGADTAAHGDVSEVPSGSEGAGSAQPDEPARRVEQPVAVEHAQPEVKRGAAPSVAVGAGVRGGFDPSSLTTLLGQKADMSTFLHETAHYFLSVYGEIAKDAEGDAGTKEDFAKLLKWFGVKDQAAWDAMSLDEQRKFHERFAYSFEKYLADGTAPSLEAEDMFARFSQWLKRVYKSVRDDLNTVYRQQHGEDLPILTGEVRDVMDRMLASDEQIQQAQAVRHMEPVFKTQDKSGMDDAQWKSYGDMANTATDAASAELAAKSVREMQWMSNAKGRLLRAMQAQHEKIRLDVQREVRDELTREEPVYRAQRFLKTGEWEGEELSDIHKMDTEETRKLLPEGMNLGPKSELFGMTKKGGLHPDDVAAAAGFSDGKEMVDAILNAIPLKDAVDAEVDRRMLDQHGELATPNGMAAAVEKAVHNEARARFIAFEMRHAFNMTESERVLVQAARETARKTVERLKFAEIQPSAYAAREAAAARQAIAAQARGDMEGVGRAKRDQLLQNAMATEALRVKAEADQHLSFLNKFDSPSKAVTKAIGADHMDAINELLAGYQMSPRDRYSNRRENMAAWITAEYNRSGVMPAVSDNLIDQMGRMHWKDMNILQLRDLRDAVKSLDYTGRRQMEVLLEGKRQTVDEIVTSVQDRLSDMKHMPVEDIRARMKYAKGLDKISAQFLGLKSFLKSGDAALVKMEQFFQWMDAGKEAGVKEAPINGPMQRVYRLASKAEAAERTMRANATAAMREVHERLAGSKINLSDALDVPELPREGNTRWYRGELISAALNMGNQSNMEKMLAGYGWQRENVMSAINRLLSPAEMSFVQGTWDHLATYGDGIRELQRRQTGVSPQMIESTPLVTKHGTFEGGYYPVVFNDVLDDVVAQKQARQADMLFENNYANPSTASGHTISRTGYIGPIFLDLGVIARHIDQVTHDLAWREAVIDMNKILSDERLTGEVNQVYGREYSKQFRPWLQAMANDKVFNTAGDSAFENSVRKIRSNFTMVGIGFRMSTMAIHGTSALSNSLGELGTGWFAKGMAQFAGVDRFQQARDFMYERSPEMANRMNEADRNIHEAVSEIEKQQDSLTGSSAARKLYDSARKFAFRGVGILDMASAGPTWMGAYLKGLAHEGDGGLGLGEDAAIAYADRAVRNAHGGGGTKDMASVQRDKGLMSLATMFYSYWNHVYNRQRDLGKGWGQAVTGQVAVRDFPKLLARSWFYIVIPQLAHTMLAGGKKGDDDGTLAGFVKEAAEGIGLGFVSGVPLVRDAANAYVHGTHYAISPIEKAGQAFINTFDDVGAIMQGKHPKRVFQNTAETLGYAAGLPTAQPAATARFLYDVIDGQQHPKDVSDWWRGVLTGKIK